MSYLIFPGIKCAGVTEGAQVLVPEANGMGLGTMGVLEPAEIPEIARSTGAGLGWLYKISTLACNSWKEVAREPRME